MLNLKDKLQSIIKQYIIIYALVILVVCSQSIEAKPHIKLSQLISTQEISPEDRPLILKLTGIIDAKNNINITSEVSGKVEKLYVKKGDFIKRNYVLTSIELNGRDKQLEAAQALLDQRQLEYEANASLSKTGYSSDTLLATSLAALRSAESSLKQAQLNLENCKIKAPFSAMVNDIYIKPGVLVNPSMVVANIIQCKDYFVKVNIPENIINEINNNDSMITFPFSKKNRKGIVNAVSMKAYNNSYSIEVKIPELDGECMNIIGMTANVDIILRKIRSYLIPPHALSLSDNGMIGIKVLDKEKIVQFYPVKILEEDEKGDFWVTIMQSVNNPINLINLGNNYVQVGQKISL